MLLFQKTYGVHKMKHTTVGVDLAKEVIQAANLGQIQKPHSKRLIHQEQA